jgi:hypothetical protein
VFPICQQVQLIILDVLLYALARHLEYSHGPVLLLARLLDIIIGLLVIITLAEMVLGVRIIRVGRG